MMSERRPHNLSDREQAVLAFVKRRHLQTGVAVSFEDIWAALAGDGFHSRTALRNVLTGLCAVNELIRRGESLMTEYLPATLTYPFLSAAGVVLAPWQPPLCRDEVDALIAALSVLLGRMK